MKFDKLNEGYPKRTDDEAFKDLVTKFNEASPEVKIRFVETINKAIEKNERPNSREGANEVS